jgi:hypothetical protein
MTKKLVILGTLVVSLLLVGTALAAPNAHSIDWWVIGGGGGSETAGTISLDSTIGQWVVGSDKSGGLQLGPGFWGGGWDESCVIFLPVVLKDLP